MRERRSPAVLVLCRRSLGRRPKAAIYEEKKVLTRGHPQEPRVFRICRDPVNAHQGYARDLSDMPMSGQLDDNGLRASRVRFRAATTATSRGGHVRASSDVLAFPRIERHAPTLVGTMAQGAQ